MKNFKFNLGDTVNVSPLGFGKLIGQQREVVIIGRGYEGISCYILYCESLDDLFKLDDLQTDPTDEIVLPSTCDPTKRSFVWVSEEKILGVFSKSCEGKNEHP